MTARVSMLLKSRASLTCFRACFFPFLANDLSAPRHVVSCGLSSSTVLFPVDCPVLQYCLLWTVQFYSIVSCGLSISTVLFPVDCPVLQYCFLWTVQFYSIFPPPLINRMIFGKKLMDVKYVLRFSLSIWLKQFSFWEELSEILLKMYISRHVKYLSVLSDSI